MSDEPQLVEDLPPIVVGVDGSRASSAALHWAVSEARRRGCAVEAVIAWRPAAMLATAAAKPPASARSIAEQHDEALSVLERALRPALGELKLEPAGSQPGGDAADGRQPGSSAEPGSSAGASRGVEVLPRAVRGSPHRVLLDASLHAEMLVIGGRTGRLGGKLPWSTGQQLVREARCPIVVVPPQD